ncbi:hypothetical protein SEA_ANGRYORCHARD_38 [Rhodococcus phage AngryOrchard]|uniref:Uncharacterized protein n=1 Tax=Rhodococcus phage AngryOrchard TaxID=1955425 RepID=A0A1S5VY44_9CAUD|nr:hypothetical protein SEA_ANGRYORCHARD_38 [Rhodococcus phage AngryOrchard]
MTETRDIALSCIHYANTIHEPTSRTTALLEGLIHAVLALAESNVPLNTGTDQ